jgi:hypothetical protein
MTFKSTAVVMFFTSVLVISPHLDAAKSSTFNDGNPESTSERQIEDNAAAPAEMRASIVDKEGDQFIAKTEEGQEFRLPVEGAPNDINVGDQLRLIPDPDAQTIQVFKVEPPATGIGGKSDSHL